MRLPIANSVVADDQRRRMRAGALARGSVPTVGRIVRCAPTPSCRWPRRTPRSSRTACGGPSRACPACRYIVYSRCRPRGSRSAPRRAIAPRACGDRPEARWRRAPAPRRRSFAGGRPTAATRRRGCFVAQLSWAADQYRHTRDGEQNGFHVAFSRRFVRAPALGSPEGLRYEDIRAAFRRHAGQPKGLRYEANTALRGPGLLILRARRSSTSPRRAARAAMTEDKTPATTTPASRISSVEPGRRAPAQPRGGDRQRRHSACPRTDRRRAGASPRRRSSG